MARGQQPGTGPRWSGTRARASLSLAMAFRASPPETQLCGGSGSGGPGEERPRGERSRLLWSGVGSFVAAASRGQLCPPQPPAGFATERQRRGFRGGARSRGTQGPVLFLGVLSVGGRSRLPGGSPSRGRCCPRGHVSREARLLPVRTAGATARACVLVGHTSGEARGGRMTGLSNTKRDGLGVEGAASRRGGT